MSELTNRRAWPTDVLKTRRDRRHRRGHRVALCRGRREAEHSGRARAARGAERGARRQVPVAHKTALRHARRAAARQAAGAAAGAPADLASDRSSMNNAGLALGTPVWSTSIADVQQMIARTSTALIALHQPPPPGHARARQGPRDQHLVDRRTWPTPAAPSTAPRSLPSRLNTTAARHDFVETPIRVTQISPAAVNTEFSTVRFGAGSGASSSSADPTTKADAVYAGFVPLVAADIADNVLYAATRPPHVTIADMVARRPTRAGRNSSPASARASAGRR